MVEVMKIMATSFRSHACTDALSAPTLQQATIDPHLSHRLWTLMGKSGSISCGIIAPFSWDVVYTRFCLYPPRVCFPVLYKFWWLYVGVNGDLLQEVLFHSQVCCIQSPSGRPLLTRTPTGEAETQFCLSLCGVSGSWCTQGLFEPSECLWWVRGLILNTISPLSLSRWGFSFSLGCVFDGIPTFFS